MKKQHEAHDSRRRNSRQKNWGQVEISALQETAKKSFRNELSRKEPSAAFGRNQIGRTTKDTNHTKKNDEKRTEH